MRLKQLDNELGYGKLTSIQREEKLVGTVIEISGMILDIKENTISLHSFGPEDVCDYDHLFYELYYDKEKFNKQMFALTPNDGVEITAKIKSISGVYPTYCEFDLLSIVKINTGEQRIKATKEAEQKKEGGCFIATVCYGNYNSPEVLVLRQFRDEKLLKTFFGKVFVKFYYSVSPFFATLISKSDLLKKSVRKYFLEPIVTRIQRQNKR